MLEKRLRSHFDWPFFGVVLLLSALGLMNLYSAASIWGQEGYANIFISQCLWMAIGFIVLFVILLFDYRILERLAYPIFIISLMLLVSVLLFGRSVSGHKSWVSFGPVVLQPSEIAKICFILALAKFYSARNAPAGGYNAVQLLIPFGMLVIPVALIMLQGDIGGCLFFLLIFATMALFNKVSRKTLIFVVILAGIGGGFFYFHGLTSYQKARIQSFLHPDLDPRGRGYHLVQSKIAVGSGHIWGKGYLKGARNKLLYLPEKHTDFIFPVLAEEWGFVGSLVVVALYFSLVLLAVQIANRAKEGFGLLTALGIAALIFWQVAINLGGVLGIMPLTGVTLPLLSYGGSSAITTFVGLGILLNISMRRFMF